MNKKIFKAVLSAILAAMMITSFAACSKGGNTEPVGDVDPSNNQKETENNETPEQEGEDQQTTNEEKIVATIEETVMWDSEDIKVTALSLTSDMTYHILNLQIENKTAKDLYVMASRTAVNSFVVEPSMGVDVPANSTVNGEFRVRLDAVKAGVIADIETRFSYSSSDYTMNRKTERVKLETSLAATYDYSYDESGTLLYDGNGIKIICQGFTEEGEPILYLSSTGELSEGCCVEAYEVYVNEKKTYSYYCEWVFTNTRNLAVMDINDKDNDGNELGEIESLKVAFSISKENLADSNPVKTELVEIPVK